MNSLKKGEGGKSEYFGEVEEILGKNSANKASEAVPVIRDLISAQLNNSQF